MASESRAELLNWLSTLLQMNITKIEQVGTGAPLCQIIDSIYGDVHLHKVKFDAIHDYEYVANFKVLQAAFDVHQIDRFIPVDKLIKLKFQDNLEFLQWMKKFWDTHFSGGVYDAVGRRKGRSCAIADSPGRHSSLVQAAPVKTVSPSTEMTTAPARSSLDTASINQGSSASSLAKAGPGRVSAGTIANLAVLKAENERLNQQLTQLCLNVKGCEEEREFYFNKLRDIEMILQKLGPEIVDESTTLKSIETILYSNDGVDTTKTGPVAQPIV